MHRKLEGDEFRRGALKLLRLIEFAIAEDLHALGFVLQEATMAAYN